MVDQKGPIHCGGVDTFYRVLMSINSLDPYSSETRGKKFSLEIKVSARERETPLLKWIGYDSRLPFILFER